MTLVSAILFAIFSLFFSSFSLAGMTLSGGTVSGTDYLSTTLDVSGTRDYVGDATDFHLTYWKLSAGGSRSETTDSTNTVTINNTKDFSGLTEFSFGESWGTGLEISSSTTPEVKYSQSGLSLSLSYLAFLAEEQESTTEGDENAEASFEPTLNSSISFGVSSIKQDVNFLVSGNKQSRLMQLAQRSLGLGLSWNPLEWLSLSLATTQYFYNKSQGDLQNVVTRLSGSQPTKSQQDVSSTIYDLPKSSSNLTANYSTSDSWSLYLGVGRSITFVEEDSSTSTDFGGNYRFENDLSLGVGASRSASSGSESWTGSVDLSYHFE